jgi:hypothetical protein
MNLTVSIFMVRMLGVECKMVDPPPLTPSMHVAIEDLNLEQIAFVYPGKLKIGPSPCQV